MVKFSRPRGLPLSTYQWECTKVGAIPSVKNWGCLLQGQSDIGEVWKKKKIKYKMVSICSIKRNWKEIISSDSSRNSERPMGLRWSLIPTGINVIIECKTLNLLLLVSFPNLVWKSMAAAGSWCQYSRAMFKKVNNENGKTCASMNFMQVSLTLAGKRCNFEMCVAIASVL